MAMGNCAVGMHDCLVALDFKTAQTVSALAFLMVYLVRAEVMGMVSPVLKTQTCFFLGE